MAGLVNGQVDIYMYNLDTDRLEQLTDDPYSEMHVQWSKDGQLLLFSTDERSFERGRVDGKWSFNLAELDIVSRTSQHIDIFPGADNLNPVYDAEGDIWFLSNRDGYRNIYKYEVPTGRVFQMTEMLTGVSGITHYAPAISIDQRRGRVAYMHFSKNSYTIYRAKMEDFLNKEVDPRAVDFAAATLPRVNPQASRVVDQQLAELDRLPTSALLSQVKYQPKFKLDYIGGGGGVGVGSSNTFGTTTGLVGAVDMLFSDILGNNQFFTSLSVNGEITDFGGVVSYINRDSRVTWGATLSHIPFRSAGFGGRGIEQIPVGDNASLLALADTFFIQRIFEQRAGMFASYPFSQVLRLEASAYATRYSSRLDRYVNLYQTDGTFIGNLIGQEREKVDSGNPFQLYNFGAALVGDNSFFGLTAPLKGHRFRFGADQYYGEFNFTAATADFRIYKFFKPIGLAFRAMHYGRYGEDANALFPIYVGNPWYVRGFNSDNAERALLENGQSFNNLVGSKVGVANFEIRIPFTGPERLALIKSGFLFSDLNFFVDGGIAWNDFDQFNPPADSNLSKAEPIFSVGASLRVNLFGAIIIEPFYAIPLLENANGTFGLNFLPGW